MDSIEPRDPGDFILWEISGMGSIDEWMRKKCDYVSHQINKQIEAEERRQILAD